MRHLGFVLAALLIAGLWMERAGADPARLYKLTDSSRFETGCFTVCDCAVLARPLRGTFGLEPAAPGPLFDEYRVVDIRWFLPDSTPNVSISGSGTYRVGGEVAVQHQMVLDLSVDGGPIQRFDSGLVTTTNGFPAIEIRIPLHGDSACFDTVLVVHAEPAATTDVESASIGSELRLRASGSNPFRERAELVVHVSRAGPVTIEVLDVHGRILRRWSRSAMTPGDHPITWDGRTASGEEAPAGLYLVRAGQADRSAVARVVRLR
jgi:hypothetical protein